MCNEVQVNYMFNKYGHKKNNIIILQFYGSKFKSHEIETINNIITLFSTLNLKYSSYTNLVIQIELNNHHGN